MNKLSGLMFCAVLGLGSASFASQVSSEKVVAAVATMAPIMVKNALVFKVGDTLNFNLTIKEYSLTGTMKMAVTAQDATTVTITQDVDLTIQKENMVEVIDKTNGKVIKLTVNGQDQTPPDSSGDKVIKQVADHQTVPAGSYDCIDVVIQDAQGNQQEIWIDPRDLPIEGMLKMNASQQGMTLAAELTSFVFGK